MLSSQHSKAKQQMSPRVIGEGTCQWHGTGAHCWFDLWRCPWAHELPLEIVPVVYNPSHVSACLIKAVRSDSLLLCFVCIVYRVPAVWEWCWEPFVCEELVGQLQFPSQQTGGESRVLKAKNHAELLGPSLRVYASLKQDPISVLGDCIKKEKRSSLNLWLYSDT